MSARPCRRCAPCRRRIAQDRSRSAGRAVQDCREAHRAAASPGHRLWSRSARCSRSMFWKLPWRSPQRSMFAACGLRPCMPFWRSMALARARSWRAGKAKLTPSARTIQTGFGVAVLCRPDHFNRLTVPYLVREEVQALLDAPDPTTRDGIRDRAMLHLAVCAGLRVSELIGLRLNDVSLPSMSIRVHAHATTTARYAHLEADPLRRASERIGLQLSKAMGEQSGSGAQIRKFGHAPK